MKTYKERAERIEEKATLQRKKKNRRKAVSITSCVLAFVLAANLVLFLPYDTGGFDISKYKDSEYYSVIEQLTSVLYGSATRTNNFNEWFGDINLSLQDDDYNGGASWDSSPDYSDSVGSNSVNQTYEEVTNNQTEGVVEGDLFKRSDKYVYYLNQVFAETVIVTDENGKESKITLPAHYLIQVYSIAGEDSALVSSLDIYPEDGTYYDLTMIPELYLSADCETLTLLTPCYRYEENVKLEYTSLITLNVSDVNLITETNRVYVSGEYVSSRMANGDILLVSNFSVQSGADFSDEAQFLPQTGALGSLTSLPVGDIVLPNQATVAGYTIICMLDGGTLTVNDCTAFLSYSDEVYVSSENAFVTRSYSETRVDEFTNGNGYTTVTYPVTEIVQVPYTDTLTVENSIVVTGEINDRYSMDEYDGVLRVFTSNSYTSAKYTYTVNDGYVSDTDSGLSYVASANLYCIDLDTTEIIASVEAFAPAGESVMSARFSGETAYVCTALVYNEIVAEDPVYQFDLSDYNNITYTDTGTIPGYSLSLITFTDDTLLGIGYGDWLTDLKISLYREEGAEVVSVTEYTASNASFSTEFKAYFIDAENGYIGLGLYYYNGGDEEAFLGYLLLHYDGTNLVTAAEITLNDSHFDWMRADYIDGYLYLFTVNEFRVVAL